MIDSLPILDQLRSIEFERVYGTPQVWSTEQDSVSIVMTRVLESAPCLREMRFSGVIIPQGELIFLLEMLGSNLEVLGIVLQNDPEEHPEDYLAELFTTAIAHNTSVRKIDIDIRSNRIFPWIVLDSASSLEQNKHLIREKWCQNRRLLDLVSRFQRHAINLDVIALEEYVHMVTYVGMTRDRALGRFVRQGRLVLTQEFGSTRT